MAARPDTAEPLRQHGAMEYTQPPTDLDAVRLYRLERVREQLRSADYAGILIFDQVNTRYATDVTNMQIWCSHYEDACAFVATEVPWCCSTTAITRTSPRACRPWTSTGR